MRIWGAAKKLSAWLGAFFLLVACEASVGVRDVALVSPPNGGTVSVGVAACAGVDGPDADTEPDPVKVQLTWAAAAGAESYRVDVWNSGGDLVSSVVSEGTTATVSWLTDASRVCPGTYTWRVTAIRSAPHSPLRSQDWSFTIRP
jgi:hypothetical protein